ncbi:MAG: monovalent cation/H+ antiporter subunit D family protein [Rhodospirillaceae bacterium]|jgi:multicomponent Na+:H+ antiporter subunit D|nr:monovalent cation/H+ antiporter subunit D family protein [Rhodospirillaceae bacterium]
MIAQHMPIIQIILPLMAAPVCLIIRHPHVVWIWAVAISLLCLPISVSLLMQVMDTGTIVYELGGWAAPWGIEYRIDTLNAFVLVIVSAIGAVVMPYARRSVEKEIPVSRIYIFYSMMLLCQTGLMGIAITGDAFNLFVFLEISSLSSYVLISFGTDRRALTAAYRYLIMGTIGATFYIIGVGFMYSATGSLNIHDLSTLIPEMAGSRTVQAALAFLTVGLGLKVALFPLHMWLPNAYTYAPSAVTVFLAATATKVAVYALIRVTYTIFGTVDFLDIVPARDLLMGMALIAMFVGSAVAIYQVNIKRMLAYSSVAQIGYMILGLSFDTVNGVAAGIIHLFNHAMMKGGLFMVLGAVMYRIGSVHLHDMAGLGKKMPLTMAAFVGGGLSLIGVPLTVGFVSKWYLIQAALEKGWWPVAALIVVSSLMAVIYVWRVVEVIYMKPAGQAAENATEAPMSLLIPTWVLIGAAVYFGIDATTTVDVAVAAAEALLGGAR